MEQATYWYAGPRGESRDVRHWLYATVDSLPICNYNYTTCKFDSCSHPMRSALPHARRIFPRPDLKVHEVCPSVHSVAEIQLVRLSQWGWLCNALHHLHSMYVHSAKVWMMDTYLFSELFFKPRLKKFALAARPPRLLFVIPHCG